MNMFRKRSSSPGALIAKGVAGGLGAGLGLLLLTLLTIAWAGNSMTAGGLLTVGLLLSLAVTPITFAILWTAELRNQKKG